MTLTEEELIDLTGYKIPSKQAEWIEKYFGFKPPRKRFTGAVSITKEQLHSKKDEVITAPEPKWKVA
jgi:hypothetical protein